MVHKCIEKRSWFSCLFSFEFFMTIFLFECNLARYHASVYIKTVDGVKRARWLARQTPNILCYYSANCDNIQIWSWWSRYLSSVGNRYPAIYVASYLGRKSEVKKCRQKDLKMFRVLLSICWIINNYSPKWRWLALDIYLAASRLGKYPPLATSTSVNSC